MTDDFDSLLSSALGERAGRLTDAAPDLGAVTSRHRRRTAARVASGAGAATILVGGLFVISNRGSNSPTIRALATAPTEVAASDATAPPTTFAEATAPTVSVECPEGQVATGQDDMLFSQGVIYQVEPGQCVAAQRTEFPPIPGWEHMPGMDCWLENAWNVSWFPESGAPTPPTTTPANPDEPLAGTTPCPLPIEPWVCESATTTAESDTSEPCIQLPFPIDPTECPANDASVATDRWMCGISFPFDPTECQEFDPAEGPPASVLPPISIPGGQGIDRETIEKIIAEHGGAKGVICATVGALAPQATPPTAPPTTTG